jgi:DNA-directed RNA polymerase subunit H|tara:strand:- start:106 stop:339 length:234 start_codon:yes stop_codon:yes gene_type:complete
MSFEVTKHELVPKHKKLSDSEKSKLFEKFNIKGKELPKISETDPAIASLGVKQGDIIKIERISKTAGTSDYYRQVTE